VLLSPLSRRVGSDFHVILPQASQVAASLSYLVLATFSLRIIDGKSGWVGGESS
jgi:hypothetical protein